MTPISAADQVEKDVMDLFGGRSAPPLVYVEWKSSLPIEIELIAAVPDSLALPEPVAYITPPGVQASPVYSRMAKVSRGKAIYISGLYGDTPTDDVKQIHEIFATLKSLLKKTGSDLNHMAKATYYCSTNQASSQLNKIRPQYYDPGRPPAASKAMVKGVGMENRGLTIDMIAVPTK